MSTHAQQFGISSDGEDDQNQGAQQQATGAAVPAPGGTGAASSAATELPVPDSGPASVQVSPPGLAAENEVALLKGQVESIAGAMERLNQQLTATRTTNAWLEAELRKVKDDLTRGGRFDKDDFGDLNPDRPLKAINHKNIDRPEKYGGDLDGWLKWSKTFKKFLKRQDARWVPLLEAVENLKGRPVTSADEAEWKVTMKLGDNMDSFKEQLNDYLEMYTKGVVKSLVEACGDARSLDAWRQMADKGHSLRQKHQNALRRKAYFPKVIINVKEVEKSVALWETDVELFTNASGEKFPDENREMLIVDMCPETLRKHLKEKGSQLKNYEDIKIEISDWLADPDNKARVNRAAAIEAKGDEDIDVDEDFWDINVDELGDGELRALVKNKFNKARQTQRTPSATPGGNENGQKNQPMQVDHRDKDCYHCGEKGHISRNCTKKAQNFPVDGTAQKGGKVGKGGGKGEKGQFNGQWPSKGQWKSWFPGPTQTQWNGWFPGKGGKADGKGKNMYFTGYGQQLNHMQDPSQWLFAPGMAMALTEKRPLQPVEEKKPAGKSSNTSYEAPKFPIAMKPDIVRKRNYEHKNPFKPLTQDDVNHEDECEGDCCDQLIATTTMTTTTPRNGVTSSTTPCWSTLMEKQLPEGGGLTNGVRGAMGVPADETAVETPQGCGLAKAQLEDVSRRIGSAHHWVAGGGVATESRGEHLAQVTCQYEVEFPEVSSFQTTAKSRKQHSTSLGDKTTQPIKATCNTNDTQSTTTTQPTKATHNNNGTRSTTTRKHKANKQSPNTTTITMNSQVCPAGPSATICPAGPSATTAARPLELPCHRCRPCADEAAETTEAAQVCPAGPSATTAARPLELPCYKCRPCADEAAETTEAAEMTVPEPRKCKSLSQSLTSQSWKSPSSKSPSLSPQHADTSIGTMTASDAEKLKDEREAEAQWEILKSMVPGYVRPSDRAPAPARLKFLDHPSRPSVWPQAAGQTLQFCHMCGETSYPKLAQQCRHCGARDCLSIAEPMDDTPEDDDGDDDPYSTKNPKIGLRFAAEKRSQSLRPAAIKRGADWEYVEAIVDSGATVTVFPPSIGVGYSVTEGEAARAGVMYEVADGAEIPNLGEKHLPIMTIEGSVRGVRAQIADVSKPLQAVRSLVRAGHVVVFGGGVDGNDHYILNKFTGERNAFIDDGINYLMSMYIIPPEESGFTRQAQTP